MVAALAMPNQRAKHLKRATITVDMQLYLWAIKEADSRGICNFSAFVRTLLAKEKRKGGNNETKG